MLYIAEMTSKLNARFGEHLLKVTVNVSNTRFGFLFLKRKLLMEYC